MGLYNGKDGSAVQHGYGSVAQRVFIWIEMNRRILVRECYALLGTVSLLILAFGDLPPEVFSIAVLLAALGLVDMYGRNIPLGYALFAFFNALSASFFVLVVGISRSFGLSVLIPFVFALVMILAFISAVWQGKHRHHLPYLQGTLIGLSRMVLGFSLPWLCTILFS